VNETWPQGGVVTPHPETRWPEGPGRRGSYPCATGRRLVGRIPR
jgi:hypothetical protein